MDRVIITGGAGFIGLHLARHLLAQGHEITLVDNYFRSTPDEDFREIQRHVRFIQADLTRPLTDLDLGTGYSHVYHMAAINGVRYANEIPHTVLRTNLLTTINLLDWVAAQDSVQTVCFASSSEAYHGGARYGILPIPSPESVPLVIENPDTARYSYAGSKIAGELLTLNYAKAYGFRARVVRFHNVYGPRMGYDHVIPQFIQRIRAKQDPFRIMGPDQTRAFCYVEDAVRAVVDFTRVDSPAHLTANIGNDREEIAIGKLADLLFEIADFRPALEVVPAPVGSPDRRCPDMSYLRRLIGYEPEVGLREGLERTFEWYCTRGEAPVIGAGRG